MELHEVTPSRPGAISARRWSRNSQEPSAGCRSTGVENVSPPRCEAAPVADRGFTLVEILVTIVLMGMTVVAVLVTLQTTIKATVIDRDHATSFAWLQAASDEIYRVPRVPCTDGQAAAISAYDAAAKSVDRPPAWVDEPTAVIQVTTVEYLGKADPDAVFEWDAGYCFEGPGFETSRLYTQRVTIEATSPDGELVKTLQMVKSER